MKGLFFIEGVDAVPIDKKFGILDEGLHPGTFTCGM
jgi:hypothetical protein